jgi:dihydrofolate reductase
MKKLILQTQTSLDGYMADKNGKTDWLLWNWDEKWTWDEELRKYHNAVSASVDVVLLSRKMATEGFIDHWAKVAKAIDNPQSGFANSINEAHKVVFTKTLDHPEWPDTVLARGELKEEVNKLKSKPGKNLIAYGGASFASSLIAAGLVDEFHLIVNPVAIGSGLSIFNKIITPLPLSLIDSTAYPSGVTVLKYGKK